MKKPKTTIMLASESGLDVGKDKYVVSCERHGTLVGAKNLKDARVVAASPEEFCDDCRDEEARP